MGLPHHQIPAQDAGWNNLDSFGQTACGLSDGSDSPGITESVRGNLQGPLPVTFEALDHGHEKIGYHLDVERFSRGMDDFYATSVGANENFEYRNRYLAERAKVQIYEEASKSRTLLEEDVRELYAKLPIPSEESLASLMGEILDKRHKDMLQNISVNVNTSGCREMIPSREDFLQSVEGTFGRLMETNRVRVMQQQNEDLRTEANRANMANESLVLDLQLARGLARDCHEREEASEKKTKESANKRAHKMETFNTETNKAFGTLIQELGGLEQDHANGCQKAGEVPGKDTGEAANLDYPEMHEGQPNQEFNVFWGNLVRAAGGGACIGKRATAQGPGPAGI